MMGQIKEQGQLFYRFRMEDHVPAGHLLRQVDGFLNFSISPRCAKSSRRSTATLDALQSTRN